MEVSVKKVQINNFLIFDDIASKKILFSHWISREQVVGKCYYYKGFGCFLTEDDGQKVKFLH